MLHVLPNALTIGNLTLGFLAVVMVGKGSFQLAAGLVLVAALFDGLDGKVARGLAATSAFGKELDSLADLISFGIAPAFLVYQSALAPNGVGIMVVSFYVICGAVRLAKFNSLNIATHFVGLPTTVAGAVLACLHLLGVSPWGWFLPGVTVALAFLMISPWRFPKL